MRGDMNIDERFDVIYQALIEMADGEEDPEAQEFNEYLIENLDIVKKEIDCKWKAIPPREIEKTKG